MNKDDLRTTEPLVSVVLCFQNARGFLEEAVSSVFAQTYRNWELLLVDDGSKDDSTEIAKGYAEKFPLRVFYLDHEYHQTKGLGASRNAGIRRCRGSYVAFLDASDVWLPGKLSAQVKIFQTQPVSVVVEPSLRWDSWCDPSNEDGVEELGVVSGTYRSPELLLALYPLGRGGAPRLSGIMVQRAVVRRCGFEEFFRGIFQIYEDQGFLCKVYLKEAVFVSAECHHKHRPVPLSPTGRESANYHKVRSSFLYWLRDYLRSQPARYKSVERLLRKAQMPYREPLRYKVWVEMPQRIRKMLLGLLVRAGITRPRPAFDYTLNAGAIGDR